MIICLANNKGGVGKTTIAVNLAYCVAQKQDRLLLIDADPIGCVVKWQGLTENKTFDVIHYPEGSLHNDIDNLSRGYTHIIIDTPPGTSNIAFSSLMTSHLVIIPIDPSALSIWSSRKIINVVRKAMNFNKRLQARLLISRSVAGTTMARQAREMLIPHGMDLFDIEIHQGMDFVKSFMKGVSVLQHAPRSKAAAQIRGLCNEIHFDKHDTALLLAEKKGFIEAFEQKIEERRGKQRTECFIHTHFVVQGRVYAGYIQDISPSGVFIETRESLGVNQPIVLTFQSLRGGKHFKAKGSIVRITPTGIGVHFEEEIKFQLKELAFS
jgi:chromosome partitioning protein